jgi:hypothetical protein
LDKAHLLRHARNTYHGAVALQNATKPIPAAYLAQIALECAFKARILGLYHCSRLSTFKDKHPDLWDKIFKGKNGHDLGGLSQEAVWPRLCITLGKESPLTGNVWNRIKSKEPERPYSLRYGMENLSLPEAQEELDLCDIVLAMVEA